MNGICRSYPESILELLEGDATGGPNRLCTTLFCISSALKKLSQKTPLPESRCANPQPPRFGGVTVGRESLSLTEKKEPLSLTPERESAVFLTFTENPFFWSQ